MSTFLEPVKEDIVQFLSLEPLTIGELADRINRPYTTVQQAHKALRDEGRITQYDRKARNGRWIVSTTRLGPSNTIPIIQLQGERYKMTDFRGTKNLPEAVTDAVHDILRAWTIIATTAERLDGKLPDDVLIKRLNRHKVSLTAARTIFENMAFFCTQMLENPTFWDVTALDNFPKDKDWEEFQPYLHAMYQHYYSRNNDE